MKIREVLIKLYDQSWASDEILNSPNVEAHKKEVLAQAEQEILGMIPTVEEMADIAVVHLNNRTGYNWRPYAEDIAKAIHDDIIKRLG